MYFVDTAAPFRDNGSDAILTLWYDPRAEPKLTTYLAEISYFFIQWIWRNVDLLYNPPLLFKNCLAIYFIRIMTNYVSISINNLLTLVRAAGGIYDFQNFKQV